MYYIYIHTHTPHTIFGTNVAPPMWWRFEFSPLIFICQGKDLIKDLIFGCFNLPDWSFFSSSLQPKQFGGGEGQQTKKSKKLVKS